MALPVLYKHLHLNIILTTYDNNYLQMSHFVRWAHVYGKLKIKWRDEPLKDNVASYILVIPK